MANYDRGVYEPSDEVRVFDGSEEDDDVEGSRLPLLIVLALLVLAMFAGVVWLAYTQGVARGRGETPVLAAANGPEKVAPSQAGGTSAPYQGFKIYEQPAPSDDSGDPAAQAAPPPKPAAAAPVEVPKPAPQQTVAAPPPVQPAPAKPEPAPANPAPQPVMAAPKPAPAPPTVAKVTPPPSAAKPAATTPAPKATAAPAPKSVAALIQQANGAPSPAPAAATGAPRQLGNPVAPAPKPVAAAPATGGAAVLQIGAYKSQADADAAWKAYKAKHPVAAGYTEDVRQVYLGEKGTWYRLRMAGFSDKDAASATCAKLKAEGGDCMLAK
jgi:hypothetical protein